jgi:hypothetical protein
MPFNFNIVYFPCSFYYINLLMKPTTAQLYLYNLRYVSASIIRPSSWRNFSRNKATYSTLVVINIYVCSGCGIQILITANIL